MDLRNFGKKYHLKLRRCPDDGTEIIPGNKGKSHVFEFDDGILAVMIMPETGNAHAWSAARAAFTKTGMKVEQNGDGEGTATFDPANRKQVRVALQYAGVRRGRKLSPVQLATLARAREKARLNKPVQPPVKTGGFGSRNVDRRVGEALPLPEINQGRKPRFIQELEAAKEGQ